MDCLDGWKAYANVCWKFFDETMSWSNASLECRAQTQTSQLISLDSDAKFEMISECLKAIGNGIRSDVWVNSRTQKAFKFNWMSNEKPIESSYWGEYEAGGQVIQEPDNGGSNDAELREACAAISKSTQFKLDDVDCETLSHFICEY